MAVSTRCAAPSCKLQSKCKRRVVVCVGSALRADRRGFLVSAVLSSPLFTSATARGEGVQGGAYPVG